jgi:CheY-like chemotaxis protein/xanthosine utilization system XapX-like protein
VAKILVADDNSNIQKMVVLALKDQGIEVVAVGNGEAAVRKISDLKPDLVLADIFMPVRNGYEVCKFVKDDSALSHIPVILLVGAFDPLDEQEAQRVGADGVLKKPFVPPDPLISMVKSALARAGVVLGAPAVPPPPPPIPIAAKPLALAPSYAVPPPPAPFIKPAPEEDFAPAIPPSRSNALTIDKGPQPLAFGSLLGAPAIDEDAVFTISPNGLKAPERDWGNSSAATEEEPEEESKLGSWRLNSLNDAVDEVPAGRADWREAAFSGISEERSQAEWAPSVEKNDLSITEDEAATLAHERTDFPAIAGPRGQEDWARAIEAVLPENPQASQEATISRVEELLSEVAPPAAPFAPVADPVIPAPPIAQLVPDVNSWMAGAVSPWEAEIQAANQLASAWDNAKTAPAVVIEETQGTEAFVNAGLTASQSSIKLTSELSKPQPEASVDELPPFAAIAEEQTAAASVEAVAPEELSVIESLLSPVTQEILHEEAAQAVAEQEYIPKEAPVLEPASKEQSVSGSAVNMDEIVAKVLARMNPDVLQAVTREILKPLVEAMIKDELYKK